MGGRSPKQMGISSHLLFQKPFIALGLSHRWRGAKKRDRITVNKNYKEILDAERQKGNLNFCEQNGMGGHLVIDWDIKTLIKVIEAIK